MVRAPIRCATTRFSCRYATLRCPIVRRRSVLSGFSRLRGILPFNVHFRRHAAVSLPGHASSCMAGAGILTGCPSRTPLRALLRSRLTLGRLTFPRNPWAFGADVFTSVIVTYAYIFFSARSSRTHVPPSTLSRMLPYHATNAASLASATVFMPGHHPRITARLVSCYALFE